MRAAKESCEDEGKMLALHPGHFEGNGETAGRAGNPGLPPRLLREEILFSCSKAALNLG